MSKVDSEKSHSYFVMNSNNSFSIENDDILKNNLNTFLQKNEIDEKIIEDFMSNFLEKIIEKFMDNIFDKIIKNTINNYTNNSLFSLSTYISKQYLRNTPISKKECETLINYFLINQKSISENQIYEFSKNDIINLGKLICFIYKKFSTFKIKSEKDLYTNFQNSNSIDVIADYQKYCREKNLKQEDTHKVLIWKELRKNYKVPPELLFISSIFCYSLTVVFDLDFNVDNLSEEEFFLFILILFNLKYIFTTIQNINLYLSNHKCVQNFIQLSQNKLIKKVISNQWNISITKINQNMNLRREWSFENDFLRRNDNIIDKKSSIFPNINSSILLMQRESVINNMNKNEMITKELIKNNNFILQIMIIICYYFSKMCYDNILKLNQLDLRLIDSLNKEILNMLEENFELIPTFDFHIIDFLSYLNSIYKLNIEFNSLESKTFEKIIRYIYMNKKLIELQISFFTEELVYYPGSIYKLYDNLDNNNKNIEINSLINDDEIINLFIQKFEDNYSKNLALFFSLIKDKLNIVRLSLFFDIPPIIIINDRFFFILVKFILNIFLLIDNKSYKLKSLKILGPNLKFDGRNFPGIDELLNEINIEQNNIYLKELSLHFQFYHIENISHLFSSGLLKLTLGDLDEKTFINVVKYISSINFTQISQLQLLSLSLLNIITSFSSLKTQLKKLFSIHFFFLEELYLYNNLIIYENEVKDLLNILNNNWIRVIGFSLRNFTNGITQLNEEETSKLIYFKDNKSRIHYLLYKLFKGNKKIINNINALLFASEKLTLITNFN